MPYDAAAQALLREVTDDWISAGVLDPLRAVVSEVWRRNLDRHEPEMGR